MPRISDETIQHVAAANDVVDVIGSYIQLRRSGSAWKALCPFHQEKTPSFQVNPARQMFKCFGCGAGGSVFRFVMDYENIDFASAVRRLAARAGIPIAEETEEDHKKRGERDRLLALHREAAAWFHENLMRQKFASHAREYLKGRGVGGDVAGRWQLGFAPEDWSQLADWARGAGYTNVELLKSGLVIERDRGDGVYDRFRNRVMFPICNDFGEVIGFSGRTLGDDPAKYVNSPETLLFSKGRVLFGLHKSKRAILAANEAVVCEGQLDLISAFEAGVENVTAPQGTAFTAQQARLLRRFAESVVLCFDSDSAGRKAVERSLPALIGAGVQVRVARVPAGEDPDSLVRNEGPEALRTIVSGAKDFFDDLLDAELRPDSTPAQRAAVARKVAGFVKIIEDPALREAVEFRVRAQLELSEKAFRDLLKAAPAPSGESDSSSEVVDSDAPELVLSERARMLCRIAIASADSREWMRCQAEKPSEFGEEFAIVDKLVASPLALETPAVFETFLESVSASERRALTNLHLSEIASDREDAENLWRGLVKESIRHKIASLHARGRQPGTSFEEIHSIHKQILDLQKRLGEV